MTTIRRRAFQRLQQVGARFGIEMQQASRMDRLPQARYLKKVFGTFGVTSVIDVGANEGQYRDFLRREVEYAGRILSIEPIPALAAQMRQRAGTDPAWTIEECAMGAEASVATFHVTQGSQFSSFLEPIEETTPIFFGQNVVAEAIPVQVETLASLIARHADLLGDRIYLKLDTQGFDLEALKGLGDRAGSVVALQTETSMKPIYKTMPAYADSIRFVQDMGFTVSQMFPNNEGHFPVLIEFDCHFVRLP